ncbi:hypothetical protein [Synechococcus sp. CB0205]|uniref:hypothetical protein n=1 Tax=Synechococcus sp. CB0205 TaxID=232363 RepID=UPI0012E9E369|nr:hypothetical protein [Synechococcus sp. CB0205]
MPQLPTRIRSTIGTFKLAHDRLREARRICPQPGKTILCMPGGGLNDLLCTTLRFYRYSLRASRQLYIGSKYSSIGPLDDVFSGWPESIEFINKNYHELFDGVASFYPLEAQHYIESEDSDLGTYLDKGPKRYITFDVYRLYPCDMLVHVGRGGGFGFDLLRRLQLKEPYRSSVVKKIASLPKCYDSVQVRFSDIQANWKVLLDSIAQKNTHRPLLVCSDSDRVIRSFVARLSSLRPVFSLRPLSLDGNPAPIHYSNLGSQEDRTVSTFCDLFAMAFSKNLYVARAGNGISGFPRLAKALHANKSSAMRVLGLESGNAPFQV